MGLWSFLKGLWERLRKGRGHTLAELARRVGVSVGDLRAIQPRYRSFAIPKRSGGSRQILAPEEPLKQIQRTVLRRLLGRLRCHAAAHGFERGRSIVTNARAHVGRAVVVRMDLQDFFASTKAKRVHQYFRKIGWNREAADMLVRLCTHEGALPQGAPTSPRLSNLVNYRLDARLASLAARCRSLSFEKGAPWPSEPMGIAYTRYADDITFSFPQDDPDLVRYVIRMARQIVEDEGYAVHPRKLRIHRRHSRQVVTGLVVNERVNLPRTTRRRLRAIAHRLASGQEATLTAVQLAGWRAMQAMIQGE